MKQPPEEDKIDKAIELIKQNGCPSGIAMSGILLTLCNKIKEQEKRIAELEAKSFFKHKI